MSDSYYLTAEVCPNGHYTTNSVENSPELRSPFCPQCGLATFTLCSHCKAKVRGEYYVPGVIVVGSKWSPSNYCFNCGNPFPWTEQKVAAAQELVDELELDEADSESLKQSIPDLSSDNPRTELAVSRYRRITSKATGIAASALEKAVLALATEAAKKLLAGL